LDFGMIQNKYRTILHHFSSYISETHEVSIRCVSVGMDFSQSAFQQPSGTFNIYKCSAALNTLAADLLC
jgi:peroxiredoxin